VAMPRIALCVLAWRAPGIRQPHTRGSETTSQGRPRRGASPLEGTGMVSLTEEEQPAEASAGR
jgi:hypothetical protein